MSDWDWKNPDHEGEFARRSEVLKRIRKEPGAIPALMEYYRDHPVAFIDDWGVTYDPRNADLKKPTAIPFCLFDRQGEYIEWLAERWQNREDGVVEKSRDMGATWLSVGFAVWMWLFYRGASIGFGSRKEDLVDKLGDPKSIFWMIRFFIDWLPVEFLPKGFRMAEHAPFMRIINPENGATITGEAGDNIGRGARTSAYFADEAAHLEHAESIDAALSQTSNTKFWVSTVNGAGNLFYRKRHGGVLPVFVMDWKDDPRKGEDWYRKQQETLDPSVLAQEVDRNYEASISNAFIPADVVEAAMKKGSFDIKPIGRLRVGIDCARFGDDSSVISIRRGRVLLKQVKMSKSDLAQVAGRARQEIVAYGEEPEQIAVDTIGIGAGVADMLRAWWPDKFDRRTGKTTEIVADINSAERMDDGKHYNLRAYMWAEMKEWLKTASIPNEHELRTDLTALRYLFKGGEMLMESKDDAKKRGVKSPDRADSLAMTFAKPTMPDTTPEIRPLPKWQESVTGMGVLG